VAALDPPQHLWREYIAEITKLEASGGVSADDCNLLRDSPAAKEALMGVTVGGSRAYLDGSVPEILERVRAAERRDAERVAAEERARRVSAEEEGAKRLAEEAAVHASELASVRSAADADRATAKDQRSRQLARYESVGRHVARTVAAMLLAAYLLISLLQLSELSPWKPLGEIDASFIGSPVISVGLVAVLAVGIWLSLTGDGLMTVVRIGEERLANAVAALIRRVVEGADATS
jgi:hypothetical protein